jgi:hypothetical protein
MFAEFLSSFKMTFSSLFLCTLLVATPYARADVNVYTAVLMPFVDGDNSEALGKVTIFSAAPGTVAYAGDVQRLPFPQLQGGRALSEIFDNTFCTNGNGNGK